MPMAVVGNLMKVTLKDGMLALEDANCTSCRKPDW
jgi:hypothetical protein